MRRKSVHRLQLGIEALWLVVGREQLPRTKVAVVHAVEDDAHALPRRDQRRYADEEAEEREHAPRATGVAERQDNGSDQPDHDPADAQTTGEDDTRTVTVADGPADEVGVSLAAERPLDRRHDVLERRRVGRVLERVEKSCALLGREIELS